MTAGAVDLTESWAAWRAEREDTLRTPHGWLSLTGLFWLDGPDGPDGPDGAARAARANPGLSGTWRTVRGGVEITAARGDGVAVDRAPTAAGACCAPTRRRAPCGST